MRRRFRRRPPLWLWLVVCLAAALAARGWFSPPAATATLLPGQAAVLAVVDGQTLQLSPAHQGRPAALVRLLGVEVSDETAAQEWLSAHLVGQVARIELDKRRRDADGAQFAYVY